MRPDDFSQNYSQDSSQELFSGILNFIQFFSFGTWLFSRKRFNLNYRVAIMKQKKGKERNEKCLFG